MKMKIELTTHEADVLLSRMRDLLNEKDCGFRDTLTDIWQRIDRELMRTFDAADSDIPDDDMDGDHESALASAGFGTDESYGDYGGADDID